MMQLQRLNIPDLNCILNKFSLLCQCFDCLSIITFFCFAVVFIKPLQKTTCVEGNTAPLQCIVSGSKFIAEWWKNDEKIVYDQKSRQECLSDIIDGIHVQVYKLIISESTNKDSGTYTLKLGGKKSSCVLSITGGYHYLIITISYAGEGWNIPKYIIMQLEAESQQHGKNEKRR